MWVKGPMLWIAKIKWKFVLFIYSSRAHWFSYHRLLDVKYMTIVTYLFRGNLLSTLQEDPNLYSRMFYGLSYVPPPLLWLADHCVTFCVEKTLQRIPTTNFPSDVTGRSTNMGSSLLCNIIHWNHLIGDFHHPPCWWQQAVLCVAAPCAI